MTNVPPKLREMWTDLYKLFDINYKMDNSEDAWNKFWKQAKEICDRHKDQKRLMEMIIVVSEIISDRILSDQNDGKTLFWEPNEEFYPYPKENG